MRRSRVILLVEPDDGIRVTFRVVLRREGFVVLEAANASDALEQMREVEPELVVTEMRLPRTSGAKLIETIRREVSENSFHVLALGPETTRHEALLAGADAFYAAPVAPEQLVKVVTALIGRA